MKNMKKLVKCLFLLALVNGALAGNGPSRPNGPYGERPGGPPMTNDNEERRGRPPMNIPSFPSNPK